MFDLFEESVNTSWLDDAIDDQSAANEQPA